MTPELTLVIVAWNSADLLPESLAAFRASAGAAGVATEVVVVDNASRDGSAAVAREAGADVVIENPVNAGFVVAASQGIARARSPWVLLANPDLRVELPFVGAVVEEARTAPADVGSLVPDIRFASDPSIVNSRGLVVDELGIPAEREAGLRAHAAAVGDVFGASSSASILRVEALRRVGGLEPAYFAYLEDVDVAWRLQRAGYRAALVERAVAVHEGSASTGEGSWLKTFLVARNRRILFRLHGPRTARARVLRTVFEIGHASVQAVSGGRDASVRGRLAALGLRRYTRAVAAAERAVPAQPVPLAPRFTLLESLHRKQTASLLMHGAAQPTRGRVRVLVDAANLKPGQGGIRTYTLGLIRALAADERLALTVAASIPEIGAVEGIDVVALDPSTQSVVGRALWREQRLPMLVRSTRAEVLVAPVPELPFRRIGVPTIAVVHDVGPLVAPAFYTPNKRLRYVATLRHASRRAATLVCVSNSTLVGLRGALGADAERCVVIGEGPQALAVPPTSVLAAEPFVLYVGSLDARKNVETLVRAFADAEPPLPARLVIVGPTEGDEVARVVGVRASGRIEHRGFVTPEELANLYASCSAVALPSLYEGFGLPVLEAFVAGAPVVVSEIPAAREVAGDAALYVGRPLDPDCWREQVRLICRDTALRERLRTAGTAVAGSHTWSSVGEAFADLIVASSAADGARDAARAEPEAERVRA